ncbi:hypothetical protein T01_5458 [Trichinella spiralis]|uniref:HIT domain-containing protein n=1 Tax=Trichinella spiralis TaxID=6334 RepID=A0A0V1B7T4_TRISP|nr:hypothetical protein T01_5458 [Trichinella spiralis]
MPDNCENAIRSAFNIRGFQTPLKSYKSVLIDNLIRFSTLIYTYGERKGSAVNGKLAYGSTGPMIHIHMIPSQ